jgi:hypothetical protein
MMDKLGDDVWFLGTILVMFIGIFIAFYWGIPLLATMLGR